ncbi:MAG: hypothetical protein EXR35_06470 [Limnohabitans sp.]|nr:hypothetical protein [Limnohabitans sp.]
MNNIGYSFNLIPWPKRLQQQLLQTHVAFIFFGFVCGAVCAWGMGQYVQHLNQAFSFIIENKKESIQKQERLRCDLELHHGNLAE